MANPWGILFLSYPKSLYSDKEYFLSVLKINLIGMFITFVIFLAIAILLVRLKNKTRKYKIILRICISFYYFILVLLFILIIYLINIKDL